jgi:hypothetical protein
VWELVVQPSPVQRRAYVDHILNELNLLGADDLKSMFPDARIVAERTCGLVKSLVAVRT